MIRIRPLSTAFAAALVAVLLGAGCTGRQKTGEPGGGEQRQGADPNKPEDQFTGRSMRLFEDAMASAEEQRKLRVYDWALLEKKFKAVVEADDRFAEGYYNLGVVYERMRKPDEAKIAYRNALQRKPTLKQAAENIAVMLQNEGKHSDAVAIYQEILRIYPEDGAARARMAALYRETGDQQKAMSLAREALMREPRNLTAYKVMMRCYMDRNNYNMAKLVALRATRIAESDPELHFTMGLIQEHEGDMQAAIAHFQHAIQLRDDYLAARMRIADIASRNQDWSTAGEQFRKIAQYDPNNLAARINLGVAYKGLGQFDKAMAEYDAAIKADPQAALAYFAMGVLLQKHKDAPEKALEYYKKFVATSRDVVPADHPVFESIRECEQYLRQMAEMKAAEERAKQEAEEQKRLEEQRKLEEEKKRQADEQAQEQAERAKREQAAKAAVDAAMGTEGQAPQAQPTSGEAGQPAPSATEAAPVAPPRPTASEQSAEPAAGEPSDEPSDAL
jgi:tetratricopeptide (TPR) repeat protein